MAGKCNFFQFRWKTDEKNGKKVKRLDVVRHLAWDTHTQQLDRQFHFVIICVQSFIISKMFLPYIHRRIFYTLTFCESMRFYPPEPNQRLSLYYPDDVARDRNCIQECIFCSTMFFPISFFFFLNTYRETQQFRLHWIANTYTYTHTQWPDL